ncbi:MAG: DNA alkylation repair protein [Solirubrobacterales bacterium]|nr:DNA alkylation repair protein [Solirubrobacterales bacterium]
MAGEVSAIREELRAAAEPDRVPDLQRFFRTGPGGYGEGDVFIGVRVPACRRIARRHRGLPLADCLRLLRSEVHEERLVALVLLVDRFESGPEHRREVYDAYLASTSCIDNWDLVDVSCPRIVGAYLLDRQRDPLYRLAGSGSVWERRIAIVSTQALIRAGELDDTFALSERLLGDSHDLIHKACGWMLREAGKRDPDRLVRFVTEHAPAMPRTMLRYAIERLDLPTRERLMAIPRRRG